MGIHGAHQGTLLTLRAESRIHVEEGPGRQPHHLPRHPGCDGAGVLTDEDHVDVGDVVQLVPAALAHREDREPREGITRYANGTVVLKTVQLPEIAPGSQVFVDLLARSNGDAYDRTGSVFVIPLGAAKEAEKMHLYQRLGRLLPPWAERRASRRLEEMQAQQQDGQQQMLQRLQEQQEQIDALILALEQRQRSRSPRRYV